MSPSIAASIVFLALSLTLFQASCGAADDHNMAFYRGSSNCFPPNGSAAYLGIDPYYQGNLHRSLGMLPSLAMNNIGFFSGTVVESSPVVFGMAMCQADIPWPVQCKRCLQAACEDAPKVCSLATNASVAYRGCVLRYSDVPIHAVGGYAFCTQNHAASVSDTAAFEQTRTDLFTELAHDLASAAEASPLMIASSNRTFNGTHKLYGLAQCSRDLPRNQRSDLTMSTIDSIPESLAEVQWSEGVSITGFSFYIRYDLTSFRVYVPHTSTGPSQPEPVTDVPPGPSQGKGGLVQQLEVIVIPVTISIIALLVMFIVIRHYQKKKEIAIILEVTGLQDISYADIKSATNNFDENHKIGEGGFGNVYKVMLNINQNVMELAVKCVRDSSAAKYLKSELHILASVKHKNVVQMVGFCNNDRWFQRGRGLYVCSEFVSKGPLDQYIFASQGQSVLEWPRRYQIIRGISAGLQYLHQERNSDILHMDLKPSNILLDKEMEPKIADFGLSRNFLNTKTHTHTYTKKMTGSLTR